MRITKYILAGLIIVITNINLFSQNSDSNLNLAYEKLREGKNLEAITIFEDHISKNPNDTRIYLQLAYEYIKIDKKDKAEQYLEYVQKNSKNPEEVQAAKKQLEYLKTSSEFGKQHFIDVYSYNIYDTYQENFISNLIFRYNNKIVNRLYGGVYTDIYTDTRTTKNYIYNDRYIEVGGFVRYNILDNLSFELRAGYVREIDFNKNSFNFKPILSFSDRFGTKNRNTNFFTDVYSAALYDHKFENFFGQVTLREVVSFKVNNVSNFETYLKQSVLGDTKQFDYNNYVELGGGVAYTFKSMYLPAIFVEATNKFYFQGNRENSFQFKAGLLFNFYKFVW